MSRYGLSRCSQSGKRRVDIASPCKQQQIEEQWTSQAGLAPHGYVGKPNLEKLYTAVISQKLMTLPTSMFDIEAEGIRLTSLNIVFCVSMGCPRESGSWARTGLI